MQENFGKLIQKGTMMGGIIWHAVAGIWTQDPERIFILALHAKKLKKNKLQTQKV